MGGGVIRVPMRPVLLTRSCLARLRATALAMGSGAEVQRPLAVVVIGGLVTCAGEGAQRGE